MKDALTGPDTPSGSVLQPPPAVTSTRAPLCHRGFDLHLRPAGPEFSVVVEHLGLTLHTETGHRSAFSAERAARQFVDDALGVFDLVA